MEIAFAESEEAVCVTELRVELEDCFFAAIGSVAGGVRGDGVFEFERVFANFGQASLRDEFKVTAWSGLCVKGGWRGLRDYFSNDAGCVDETEMGCGSKRLRGKRGLRLRRELTHAVTGQEMFWHNELCRRAERVYSEAWLKI
jgi:hypothetical protein